MTQLFDTTTYEDLDETAADHPAPAADNRRHLRSIPAGEDMSNRRTQWQLDDHTIEAGRKGIQAARQALQDAARAQSEDHEGDEVSLKKADRRAA